MSVATGFTMRQKYSGDAMRIEQRRNHSFAVLLPTTFMGVPECTLRKSSLLLTANGMATSTNGKQRIPLKSTMANSQSIKGNGKAGRAAPAFRP